MICQLVGNLWLFFTSFLVVELYENPGVYPSVAILVYLGGTAVLALALFMWIRKEKAEYAANKMFADSYWTNW